VSPVRTTAAVSSGHAPTRSTSGGSSSSSSSQHKAAFGTGAFSKSAVVYADEEIAGATVLAQPVVQEPALRVIQEPALRPKPTGPKKASAALTSAIGKIKSAALGTAAELKEFRKFLKPMYTTPGEAYDDFAGSAHVLDRVTFYARLEELGYRGNYERLFNGLRESEHISREAFKQRLVAVGRTPAPNKNKKLNFGTVVVHAVETMKEDKKEATGKDTGASAGHSTAPIRELRDAGEEDASEGPSSAPSSPSKGSSPTSGQRSTVSRWNRNSRRSSLKEDVPARRPPSAPVVKTKPPLAQSPDGRKKTGKLSVSTNQDDLPSPLDDNAEGATLTGSLEYSFEDKSEPNSPTLPDSTKPVRAA